jgi:biotin carboxylase
MAYTYGMRVLLSEGSGLTSRQAADRLRALGHEVGALSSERLGLARFTRAVTGWHAVPRVSADPAAWLAAAITAYRSGGYDVLLPTQEQVAVLAARPDRLAAAGVVTAVPRFEALAAVLDKRAATATLDRLGVAQPETTVLRDAADLAAWDRFPVFVKTPIGTASAGVWSVGTPARLAAVAAEPVVADALAHDGLIAQVPVAGPLAMLQAVFDDGELVAFHATVRAREGVRGGASHKIGTALPAGRAAMATLGAGLRWRGALALDAIVTPDGPVVIDVNPRLVEPGNAARSGVDLVGALLDLAVSPRPVRQPPGREGVRTHQVLLAVLGAAESGSRRRIAVELVDAVAGRGDYHGSHEELTPVAGDLRALAPVALAAGAGLVAPSSWRWFSNGSVEGYALSAAAWRSIRADAVNATG